MKNTTVVLMILSVLLMPGRAQAHDPASWILDWTQQSLEDGRLMRSEILELLEYQLELQAIREVTRSRTQPSSFVASTPSPVPASTPGVEQWMPLISKYFQPADIPWATRVMWCESRGNQYAKNPTSSASGLYQHLARFWTERSAAAGWAGADIFDAEANIAVASWLYYTGGPSHWVCK